MWRLSSRVTGVLSRILRVVESLMTTVMCFLPLDQVRRSDETSPLDWIEISSKFTVDGPSSQKLLEKWNRKQTDQGIGELAGSGMQGF